MDRQKFMEQMRRELPGIDADYVDSIVEMCVGNLNNTDEAKALKFVQSCRMSVVLMEETSELIEAMSQRVRGRVNDNYNILEESADVILDVLCACKLFGISAEDLQKAIMVKCKRQEQKAELN